MMILFRLEKHRIVAVMMMLVCVQVIECTGEESTLEALPGESWDRWVAIGVSGCTLLFRHARGIQKTRVLCSNSDFRISQKLEKKS